MLLEDAVLLATVFMGSQILGLVWNIPGTAIGPHHSTLQRLSGSFQLTGTLYALQHFHLQIHPEAAFDSIGEPEQDPLVAELDSIVQRAMDHYVKSRDDMSPEPFIIRTGTSVDNHPAMHAINNFFQKRLHQTTPEYVTVSDTLWKEIMCTSLALIVVIVVWNKTRNIPDHHDACHDNDNNNSFNSGIDRLRKFMEVTLQDVTSGLQNTIRKESSGNDSFAASLESFRDSIGQELQENLTRHVERTIQQELQMVREGGTNNDFFAAHLKTFHTSVDQILQENATIRQGLQAIRSDRSGDQSLDTIMEQIQGKITLRLQEAIHTEFENLRNGTVNLETFLASIDSFGEAGDFENSGNGSSGLEHIRNTCADWREKYTDLRDSISLIKESLTVPQMPRPDAETTDALDRLRSQINDQLHGLEKRIGDLEEGSFQGQHIVERVSELGNKLFEFKRYIEDLQNETKASASIHRVEQLEKQLNDYISKWDPELDKIKTTVSFLESLPAPVDKSLFVLHEDNDKAFNEIMSNVSALSGEFEKIKQLSSEIRESLQIAAQRDEVQDKSLEEIQETVSKTVSGVDELGAKHANLESFLNAKPFEARKKTEDWLNKIEYLIQLTAQDNSKISEGLTKVEGLIQTGKENCDERKESMAEAKSLIQRTTQGNGRVASKLVGARKLINATEDIYKKGEHRLVGVESSIQSETERRGDGARSLKELASGIQKIKEDYENNRSRLTTIESDFYLREKHMDMMTSDGVPTSHSSSQRSIDSRSVKEEDIAIEAFGHDPGSSGSNATAPESHSRAFTGSFGSGSLLSQGLTAAEPTSQLSGGQPISPGLDDTVAKSNSQGSTDCVGSLGSDEIQPFKDVATGPSTGDGNLIPGFEEKANWADELRVTAAFAFPEPPKRQSTPTKPELTTHSPVEKAGAIEAWNTFSSSSKGRKSTSAGSHASTPASAVSTEAATQCVRTAAPSPSSHGGLGQSLWTLPPSEAVSAGEKSRAPKTAPVIPSLVVASPFRGGLMESRWAPAPSPAAESSGPVN